MAGNSLLHLICVALSAGVWASSPAVTCAGEAIQDDKDDAVTSLLQMSGPADEKPGAAHQAEQLIAESDRVHAVCVCDCNAHCEWQVELMFYSAQRVGQRGPITAILTECTPERRAEVARRHAHVGLPEHFRLHFFERNFNEPGTHVMNKPLGVAAWFREVGPERDVLAVIDPDFLFLKPLTATVEGASSALGWPEGPPAGEVRKGVVVAQRWAEMRTQTASQQDFHIYDIPMPIKNQTLAKLTPAELRTWICTGTVTASSGCTHMTQEDHWLYHASGPPMLAHREDWDGWLVDSWRDITLRLRLVYKRYFLDMWSWMLANIHHRQRELLAHTYQYGGPSKYEPWGAVAETVSKLDPCEAPMEEVLANPRHATFLHFTWYSNAWNKIWFQTKPPQVFERCDTIGTDQRFSGFLHEVVNKTNMTRAFTTCVARRFMAAALKRSCAGTPAAVLVDRITRGFTL